MIKKLTCLADRDSLAVLHDELVNDILNVTLVVVDMATVVVSSGGESGSRQGNGNRSELHVDRCKPTSSRSGGLIYQGVCGPKPSQNHLVRSYFAAALYSQEISGKPS